MDRTELADLIVQRLDAGADAFAAAYAASRPRIGHFVVDDLLPSEVARRIHACFPAAAAMQRKKTLREYKYIAAQMDRYDPILEEAIYAFQDPRVVAAVARLCEIAGLTPDVHLYAGGISLMRHRNYLNPHLDNSHDKDRAQWRVLNLLYYVTPNWHDDDGGHLELWPEGPGRTQQVIHSRFNRLAVMATHGRSWHSVSPVQRRDGARCCLSNYYFSAQPLRAEDSFHVTAFRARPGQPLTNAALQADAALRMGLRRLFRRGVVAPSHLYRK